VTLTRAVPNAPFKGDAWLTLALKRAVLDAVDRGSDQLAWSDSQVLVERWGEEYRTLYMTQYNDKMPSIIKKLTGQTPRHVQTEVSHRLIETENPARRQTHSSCL
jgi:hypothetical protein